MTRCRCVAAVAAMVLVAACAPGQAGQDVPSSPPDLITGEQIDALGVSNAGEAVERLHPEWLRGRGGELPILYIDESRVGALGNLGRVPAETIRDIRFIAGTQAAVRYGLGHGGGVISVRTVRRDEPQPRSGRAAPAARR